MTARRKVVPILKNYFYYKGFLSFFTIVLLILLGTGCGAADPGPPAGGPRAENGILRLEGHRFDRDGNVRLEGEWFFYWRRLLTPLELLSPSADTLKAVQTLELPGFWNGRTVNGEELGGSGYATYRLKVKLDDPVNHLALYVPSVRTAYKVWVNGELMAEVGSIGMDLQSSVPRYKAQVLKLDKSGMGTLDIVLQVSNFHHRLGGVLRPIELGSVEGIHDRVYQSLAFEMLIIGSLLSMGLYHIGLYALRRKERGALFFGLFCVLVGIRASLIGSVVLHYFWKDLSWVTGLRIEYICFFIGVPAILMFVRSLYPLEVRREAVRTAQGLGLFFSVAVFFFPAPWFTYFIPFYQGITVVGCVYMMMCIGQALARRREGAVFAVVGAGSYITSVVIDILYYNQWIRFGEVSSYGLLFCVFMTSFILSAKSAKAYRSVETLSRQMREMNQGLEEKIRERTAELQQINRSLEKMNEDLARMETSRRHLLSNISHDLGTPMTLIQGYVEALIDGVVTQPDQQQKYLKLIHGRITGLSRLIADLFQLSKLEARQLDFDIRPVPADDFIRYFEERYELELAGAGLRFEMISHVMKPADSDPAWIRVDLDRIDQVLTNIIYNAVKHTPAGGLIQLLFIVDEYSLVVQVQDNGTGIDPEDLPYIFDRFYKKDKSRNTARGGSGLGLAIAKEIIDYHGGRIWAQSMVGQGACLAFMLPLVNPAE
ncbi:ATP-binding protein [Paenibacillus mucilaginosus]|uniref:histidine kinase n=1 Tax=Paenibacillus mucilaginosus (strain KNP414) TaxID=1036673 RepID=F8FEU3_PAEMK|nr:ATP-binding protein [Paenibacillus mucilaginosus]AEI46178.1 integral membrane sensor signal transduction histidine kinase [Paenibacillus mucilaginosus KNP414]MCG7213690.1 ATP-binding protein [Paenibacillus mucilaginosus]WDM27506.1 histidine kinase [Paenibacillus mucilaginosus]